MCILDMATAESNGHEITEAIRFNWTNPKNENENLLNKYFPKAGVEVQVGKLDASKNNSRNSDSCACNPKIEEMKIHLNLQIKRGCNQECC